MAAGQELRWERPVWPAGSGVCAPCRGQRPGTRRPRLQAEGSDQNPDSVDSRAPPGAALEHADGLLAQTGLLGESGLGEAEPVTVPAQQPAQAFRGQLTHLLDRRVRPATARAQISTLTLGGRADYALALSTARLDRFG
jgi:hypothetical protein